MKYNPDTHHRRSIRLKGYDYKQAGAYFVTVCTPDRTCFFGDVVDGEMQLNDTGRAVRASWNELPARFQNVVLDAFVVMPNHIHGIVIVGAQFIAPTNSSQPPDCQHRPGRDKSRPYFGTGRSEI